ncbi:sodium/proton antiporter, CPA1 family [Syntrophus gentianae]|uniref:Sodium/proton antiporter, CPA1 family n=1 Tax=Syntrophus gentianae TaxID=43775 RepID=A0A1H8B2I4_9BACT|nr:sodium:proton antiporter [Syntrophus gentianae]SEM76499.1 sodium/proton antiporter, CPA1 family [Syntrophus gentianae]
MEFIIKLDRFLLILLIASMVAILTRRLKVPYSLGLVFAGIILALFPLFSNIPFTKELIFNLFLPPLVFEAAIQIRWRELRREFPLILVLVTAGLCLSAAVTALGMRYFADWAWISALLFGALISATDPVSVIATFNEAGIHSRIRLLVEAESLLNDGTAAVAFAVILASAVGGAPTLGGIAGKLALTIGGGVLCGALIAGAIMILERRAGDNLVEFTLTTVAAYGSFLIAEHFHFSGVLASLTTGLLVGNLRLMQAGSTQIRESITAYWEYLGFLANSCIFIGIGVQVSLQNFKSVLLPAIFAILLVLLGRAFAVYPFCALFGRSELLVQGKHQLVLFWGGLRGALALALAVGLPPWVPNREEIISVTFAVVAFSIFVQGMSMTPLLRRIGEIPATGASVDKE